MTGEAAGPEPIERGAERSFRFEITEANARFGRRMLAQAGACFMLDYETWAARCNANNLLASALVSTFVGKCIPGSYGTCLNFDAAFAHPLVAGPPVSLHRQGLVQVAAHLVPDQPHHEATGWMRRRARPGWFTLASSRRPRHPPAKLSLNLTAP